MARILVVDDENNIRMMVQLALEQVNHSVDTATDGPSGLAQFGDGTKYDLVLLDQRMPGMEGLEVLREIKARAPGARIIMITAFGTIDLAVDAMKAGATDFLRKPFTTETLRGAVTGALAATPMPVEPPPSAEAVEAIPLLYGLTTVNGYHIESDPKDVTVEQGDMTYTFDVRHPSGNSQPCTVLLSARVISDAKAVAHGALLVEEGRFWHALCEHALSNYLYQNADFPPGSALRIDEIDRGIRNWVKAVAKGS